VIDEAGRGVSLVANPHGYVPGTTAKKKLM
jgi:hypothetical protein